MRLIPVALLLACAPEAAERRATGSPFSAQSASTRPTSVLLILMDDMRADDLWAMPTVQEQIGDRGLTFSNAYVNTPVCCPSRASIAAGGFLSQSTGVLTNYEPNGSASKFDDSRTLAIAMQDAGYRTGFIGKYLHGQPFRTIPRAWSFWIRPVIDEDWSSYDVVWGSSTSASTGTGRYTTSRTYLADYIAEQAEVFLDRLPEDTPFFLWLNHWAPHYPATPHPDDEGDLDDLLHRPPNHNEEDVDDKPRYVKVRSTLSGSSLSDLDAYYQRAMESLRSADRSIEAVLASLEAHGRLDDTVIIFTSDNGYLYGEHRLTAKGSPYQESIKVPLLIRAPGGATGTDDRLVSISTDIGATIQDIAGLSVDSEGSSLVPVLAGRDPTGRSRLLVEAFDGLHIPTWSAVVGQRYKYVSYAGGQREFYDLLVDPYELNSLHGAPTVRTQREAMAAWLDDNRGLALKTLLLRMRYDRPESQYIEAWGGTPPYSFSTTSTVPPGLTLDADGRLWGQPSELGTFTLPVTVTGSGLRAHSGAVETYANSVKIEVTEVSGRTAPPLFSERETIHLRPDGVDIEVPAPDGFEVFATLSPLGDFSDALRLKAVGPGASFHFDDLPPGARFEVLVEGPHGSQIHEITLPD